MKISQKEHTIHVEYNQHNIPSTVSITPTTKHTSHPVDHHLSNLEYHLPTEIETSIYKLINTSYQRSGEKHQPPNIPPSQMTNISAYQEPRVPLTHRNQDFHTLLFHYHLPKIRRDSNRLPQDLHKSTVTLHYREHWKLKGKLLIIKYNSAL